MDYKKIALFVGGTLFGSAGLKILGSRDAKKAYANVTRAAIRAKDATLKAADSVREAWGDVLSDAKNINEQRDVEAEAEVIEDAAEETTEE